LGVVMGKTERPTDLVSPLWQLFRDKQMNLRLWALLYSIQRAFWFIIAKLNPPIHLVAVIIFSTFPIYLLSAQPKLTDSLKHELVLTNQDTSRVLVLSELCLQYRLSKPDSAFWYGQKALHLARQINYLKGEANALGSIGFVMREVGNLPNALRVEFKAIQIAEGSGDVYEIARSMNIVGNIYLDLKDFPNALRYYHLARQKHTAIHHEPGLAITQSNIGSTYEQMNKLDSAWYYERQAYQKMLRLNLVNNMPYVLRILGNIQAKRGNPSLAMHYYRQSQAIAQKEYNLRNIAFANTAIARLYQKINQLDSCVFYAKKSLLESEKGSFIRGVLIASSILAEVYETRNTTEALRYYKLAAITRDKLYGAEKLQSLQSITFDEQERQRDLEAAQLAYQQQVRQYILLISLLILLLIALILWRINLQKQKANALLFQQKLKIGQQSDQLTLMMQELHHRVKNNFAIVTSLLKLQSVRLEDEKAIQAMLAGQQRVEAMSLIHQRLYQSNQVTTVNMDEYMTDLAKGLMGAYGYNLSNFDLYLNIEYKTLDVDIAMPLGLIANELLTNAFKHAYSNNKEPMLRISLFNGNGLTLEVQDNGPGLDMASWKKRSNKSSFGKQLIVSLCDQLEAHLDVIQHNGTLFRINIPKLYMSTMRTVLSQQALPS
jgi:two-component sensor histidine kinase